MSDPRSGDSATSLDMLRDALRRFAAERDWDQFAQESLDGAER